MHNSVLIRIKNYWWLLRGFTLIAPFMGIVSGSVIGASVLKITPDHRIVLAVILVALASAMLNGASNILNQYYDIEIDRENSLKRPLVMKLISPKNAIRFMVVVLGFAMVVAFLASPNYSQTLIIFIFGFLVSVLYSVPPFRLKRFTWFSNLSIATARGFLLPLAGWSVVGSIFYNAEPWFLALVFAVCIFFIVSAKDLRDIKGDRRFGVKTIPVVFGDNFTRKFVSIGFILPGVMIFCLASLSVLVASRIWMYAFALLSLILGLFLVTFIKQTKSHEDKVWQISYFFLLFLQVGLSLVYFIS